MRERDTEREIDRDREKERQRERDRQRQRETETKRERDRQRQRDRQRERDRQTDRQTEMYRSKRAKCETWTQQCSGDIMCTVIISPRGKLLNITLEASLRSTVGYCSAGLVYCMLLRCWAGLMYVTAGLGCD